MSGVTNNGASAGDGCRPDPRSGGYEYPTLRQVRRINREAVVVLGWGSAILLQFAHPLVAAGVADFSGFRGGPRAFVQRMRRTIGAMLGLTFGTEEVVRQRAAQINAIHDRVHGTLKQPAGRFPAGTPYSARDPELLRWVHTTLISTLPRAYELFVEPLRPGEEDRYCAEAAGIEPLLGMPAAFVPASVAELDAYMTRMFKSGAITVTDTARKLADALLAPPFGVLAGPLLPLGRLVAVGLLPPAVREEYGFSWGAREDRRLRRWARVVRTLRSLAPAPLREWPIARAAG